jgi:hypothetical protein
LFCDDIRLNEAPLSCVGYALGSGRSRGKGYSFFAEMLKYKTPLPGFRAAKGVDKARPLVGERGTRGLRKEVDDKRAIAFEKLISSDDQTIKKKMKKTRSVFERFNIMSDADLRLLHPGMTPL